VADGGAEIEIRFQRRNFHDGSYCFEVVIRGRKYRQGERRHKVRIRA
jgi:hypothetical protein